MNLDVPVKNAAEELRQIVAKVGRSFRPYIPTITRFFIVATFYEDAFRMTSQWKHQRSYLTQHVPDWLALLFLLLNITCMVFFSTCIMAKRREVIAAAVLSVIVVTQAVTYGLVFNMLYFLRTLSVLGSLLLCLSAALHANSRKASTVFSLPPISHDEQQHQKYFQLVGRVLVVLVFIGLVFNGEWGVTRILLSLLGAAAWSMTVIGLRGKWCASFLGLLLCILNVSTNDWWWRRTQSSVYQQDFKKFDFFQTLSIVGGLLLLASIGPGSISYDEKKKEF